MMNGPRHDHLGVVHPATQFPPLTINIPNSMNYRNAPAPQLSPTDDNDLTTPKKQDYYRPPGSPESPEVPQAFFNYNHDRIQNDLLDEICDEIGIKDATDLDFMDFEPPGLDDAFNPDVAGDEIDNLDQLIMFGQIDPQHSHGNGHESSTGRDIQYAKWGGDVTTDQSVPQSGSMPHNSPVYGNSPTKLGHIHEPPDLDCHVSKAYQSDDVPHGCASPHRQSNPTWQQNNVAPGHESAPSYCYEESHSSQVHMTDDYKIASPHKNSTDNAHCSGAAQAVQHHDSMLKMAIAQDRILGGRVASPIPDMASPHGQVPASPGCPPESPTSTHSIKSTSHQNKSQQLPQAKVNQTDSSKGLDQFTAPENLPPGKERAMSRMKLVDGPGSGKRSPFDQGYFSVGSGGSHHEDNDLSAVGTPPHCVDQPQGGENDKMFDFLTRDVKSEKSLTDDVLLTVCQNRVKKEHCAIPGVVAGQNTGQQPNASVVSHHIPGIQQDALTQSPRSPNIARREIHRAVLPRPSAVAKQATFQRQNSQNNQAITFDTPVSVGNVIPKVQPNQCQGYSHQALGACTTISTSVNCAPYPRNCHPDDMPYGSKRSGSNPSSPKKQRRLTYAPYQGDNPVVFTTNPVSRYNRANSNMAGRPANTTQYGQQARALPSNSSCQLSGDGALAQPLTTTGEAKQLMDPHSAYVTQSSLAPTRGPAVPGAHGAGVASLPLSSHGEYVQGQYSQQRQNQYSHGHHGQYSHSHGHASHGQHPVSNGDYQHQNSSYQQQTGYQHFQHLQHTRHPNIGYQQMSYSASGQTTNSPQQLLPQQQLADTSSHQESLSSLIANHPEAARYGFMQQLISDRTNAFRSHPLFPLLRDLIVADMNFSSTTFPFQLIANLPQDFDKLLSNYFQRNPPTTKYETNSAVENVVVDALRYAHKSLIEKITERKRKQGILEQPKMFSAIEDFCERFDQAVKHTMTRSDTPEATAMHSPLPQPTNQQQPMPPPQQIHAQHQMAPANPVMPRASIPQSHYHPGTASRHNQRSNNGPHGNMAPTGGVDEHQQQQLRSASPFSMTDQSTANMLSRQSNYPQTAGGWGPNRSLGPPGGVCSSLPSTPTKYGGIRHGHYQNHSNSTLNLSDVDLSSSHLSEQQKSCYGTGSMPNFVSSRSVCGHSTGSQSSLSSPYKMRGGSPGPELQRVGSEPSLASIKYCGSPQREYGKDSRSSNTSQTNSTGSRKQVLPKEAVAIMLEWLREHRDNPYPNDDEKYMLIQQTKLTMAQINYWFTNARRRILPKWTLQRLMEEQARATGRELTADQQKEILSTKLTPQAVRNILEGQAGKKAVSDISYGHIMNSVINQSS